ncbi:MAG: PH domain-containing protein [Candidatus Merdivicinus sp.]|jgi:putative membrane protein
MNNFQRQHPLFIIHAFSKYLLLLLLPLLRSLILLQGDVWAWVRGTWFDILVIFGIIGAGIAQWLVTLYDLREKGIAVQSGFFLRESRYIPYKNLSSIVLEEPFYLRPFRIVRLRLETDGGSTRQPDASFLLRRKQAEDIVRAGSDRLKEGLGGPRKKHSYRPRTLYIAILSLITSNTLTGVLFASTFLSQSGKVLGEQFERMLVQSFTKVVEILAFNVPPAAAMAAAVLLGGWGLAFLINLLSNLRFRAEREGRLLSVQVGIFTKRAYHLAVERVNYIMLRQNLVTRLCGFCSAFLNCTGYGKVKNELAVLLPAAGDAELRRSLKMILPEFRVTKRQYRPYIRTLTRFLIPPLTTMLAIFILFGGIWILFPDFRRTTWYIGLMAEIPAIWWLFVKIAAYFHVGIGIKGDMYTFRYTFAYAFFTVVVHRDKIARVETRQSLFQKMSDCADVVIYTFSERHYHLRIHNIHIREVEEFLRIFGEK